MRVLIAVNSCWKDLLSNHNIRETWGARIPGNWDLRFFVGSRNFLPDEIETLFTTEWIGSPGTLGHLAASTAKKAVIGKKSDLQDDEIIVDCPDGYLGLPWKTIESLKWALARNYDGIFRVFVDTYLFPDRLEKTGFTKDAIGWAFGCGPCPAHPKSSHSCPLGGAGYWLSRKAAQKVIAEPVRHWGEDTHVGFALANAGITLSHDPRYVYDGSAFPEFNRVKVSIHLNDRGTPWNPKMMLITHEEQEAARLKYPNWDGTCKRDGTMEILKHPRGPRCKLCGVFV